MLKKITKIHDIHSSLTDSILCMVQPKNEDKYNFGYITRNSHLGEVINGYPCFGTLDILEKKVMREYYSKEFAGFYGEVFKIASLKKPHYGNYLKELNFDKVLVNFSNSIYSLNDFGLLEVRDVLDNVEHCYQVTDQSGEVFYLNEYGRDEKNNWIASNYKESFFEDVFKEQEGYLYLTNEHGPLFVSKTVYNKFENPEDVLEHLNIINKEYDVFPVLNILFEDEIVDTVLLNTKQHNISKPVTEYQNFHETMNSDVFTKYNKNNDESKEIDDLDYDIENIVEIENEDNDEDFDWDDEIEVEGDSNDENFGWDDEIEIEDDSNDEDFDWDDEIEIEEEDK